MIGNKQMIMIFLPAILVVSFGLFLQTRRYEPLLPKANADSVSTKLYNIPILPEDPIIGNPLAPLTIINFADFGCDHCKDEMALLDRILKQYPNKLKIIWKGLPVTRFPYPSDLSHDYAYCANAQGKFAAFANAVFAHNESLTADSLNSLADASQLDKGKLTSCLSSSAPATYRDKTATLASTLKITGVPAVFIQDKQVDTPTTLEGWKVLLGLTP